MHPVRVCFAHAGVCIALTVTEIATICGCVQFGHSSIWAHVNQKTITNKSDNIVKRKEGEYRRRSRGVAFPVTHIFSLLFCIVFFLISFFFVAAVELEHQLGNFI